MRVHYISPFSVEKNIGLAINEAVRAIRYSPDDWFVLTDHDMLWLLPDSKAQVERILRETDYDVLGCMTNRIRSTEQLIDGFFNQDDHIGNHIILTQLIRNANIDSVKECLGALAAFMLCFRVSVWEYVAGFTEESITFDTQFCRAARESGFKLGIMTGVYVWHSYRLTSKNPIREINHLLNKNL